MKTLIIYYSESGSTEIISKVLAYNLNADIVMIQDLKPRDGFKNRLTASFDAFRENKTEIYPPTLNLENYDLIYIGTPVWASKPSPAISTIIDSCDLRRKDVILFTTMTSSGGAATIEKLEKKVKARGGRVVETFTIKTKDKDMNRLMRDAESIIDILDLKIYK
ncbi:MAG: flavodoxin [Methanobrevibacter sp.]|uniref:flavodoxin family protein n=1 Tax=Methanobrevibacter sp. TaxID=66852 RepID=UPI0026E04A35|nr:flavodoxin [Methanobrevibacter sp.]MDO5848287.1 flavodoxin [Methanobrevibacter sp.]